MAFWGNGGTVLRAQGGREQEGSQRHELTSKERSGVARKLKKRREKKKLDGKDSYQDDPLANKATLARAEKALERRVNKMKRDRD